MVQIFLENIPLSRPVVLIQHGHVSHVSVELNELARADMCVQPLDVGVFKSFKANFSKVCSSYIAKNPGSVITTDVIASPIGSAWPSLHTPVNIMNGFKKSGVYPFNLGSIDDRELAPSKAFQHLNKMITDKGVIEQYPSDYVVTKKPPVEVSDGAETLQPSDHLTIKLTNMQVNDVESHDVLFTTEQERLYEHRFQEGYDVKDPSYEAWVRINHPGDANSECCKFIQ